MKLPEVTMSKLERKSDPPFDTLTRRMLRTLENGGSEALSEAYESFRAEFPWVSTEWEMIRLSRMLLDGGRRSAAIVVLELSSVTSPNSQAVRAELLRVTDMLDEIVPVAPRSAGEPTDSAPNPRSSENTQ